MSRFGSDWMGYRRGGSVAGCRWFAVDKFWGGFQATRAQNRPRSWGMGPHPYAELEIGHGRRHQCARAAPVSVRQSCAALTGLPVSTVLPSGLIANRIPVPPVAAQTDDKNDRLFHKKWLTADP